VADLTLHRDEAGRLVLTNGSGQSHVGVEPVRAFPISDPERWISLLDSRGCELASVDSLADLPPQAAELIRQELADREFLPRVEQVVRVKTNKEPHQWHVLTDRGPAQFLMRDEDIRRLGPTKAILVDMHGVRYYVPDSSTLDAHSRRILSRYL
jgi:hypothetical protein